MNKLSYESGGIVPETDGTYEGLCRLMKRDGVNGFAVLNIATNPGQMINVNNFAASLKGEGVYSFGSVHPDAENAEEELERIKKMGLFGVKFHPEGQDFFVDDEKMKPIYRKISQLGLPVVFHAGKDPAYHSPFHCTPSRLAKALKWLDVPVIAAHWGALGMEDDVISQLCGLPVYMDTSQGYGIISRYGALKIIEKHGTDKMVFASDAPWGTPQNSVRLLSTLELTDAERADILWNNAMRILNK